MSEEKEETPECCKGCIKWNQFKEKCFVYWDLKKECTMHIGEGEISPIWSEPLPNTKLTKEEENMEK
ncbi:MAG: hypothetical protein V1740_04445 [Candidatus Woesearchaeota archaeon]